MSSKRTSSVWPVMPEILRIMRHDIVWPSIPQVKKIDIGFGALMGPPAGEAVTLTGSTRRGDQEWVTAGTPGKDDRIEAQVVISTNVPGFSAEQAFGRLAELGATLEAGFRDQETGKPVVTDALIEAQVLGIWVAAVDTAVIPMNSPGANGWLAAGTFVLSWWARI